MTLFEYASLRHGKVSVLLQNMWGESIPYGIEVDEYGETNVFIILGKEKAYISLSLDFIIEKMKSTLATEDNIVKDDEDAQKIR